MKRTGAILVQIAVTLVITAMLLEGLVAWSFRNPGLPLLPGPLVRYLHIRFDRNVIQVMPECAMYDEALTYRLKPGQCVFASREFSNRYEINSLGVRDDEASLRGPQTVVLGDSLAMGWGVEQSESFPSVYERLSGHRTLNTAVASYGTVREMRMLERVDRSELQNVVIQYNENDTYENQQFVEQPPFRILSREQYERTVHEQAGLLRYYPGKYAFNVMIQFQSAVRGRTGPVAETVVLPMDRQAELFVRVLERSAVDLSADRVVALAMDTAFIEAGRAAAARSTVGWVTRVEFLDAGKALAGLDHPYYVLDDHPRANAHEAIGKLLAAHLTRGD